ncbi:ligase-associated DNA damage response endonuclease PdeM [Pontivivens insulae]|uniref:3',5'-cyclic adenosine monophosphate phosphodiesterase CpdA n=1 Tax=Pontivivens insulae TaxID=1639689 RepID=A0A2R8A8P3_9RHOB|nr:ligase-associated DNA damage response endonuclease PdeM [Pontivivens insulae]RED18699.1 putative phosphoesterase [Pontivivens insulae]SPF28597.1 3',5'-cyclic adenosine monophosphate phosphodiesterase CpdA [Pontivivens insulae]
MAPFRFHTADLDALESGALYWAAERLLCVSDLHLGKSERIARRGGALLPPYDTRETLDRLSAEIARHDPATVICLGDSFDDLDALDRLAEAARRHLLTLMAGRRWIWIEGNHDPGPTDLGGEHLFEASINSLTFRHVAEPGTPPGEVSGHYHPKASLTLRGRRVSSACFLSDATRLILPAFGAYTGGLKVSDPAVSNLMMPEACVRLTRAPQHAIPLRLVA